MENSITEPVLRLGPGLLAGSVCAPPSKSLLHRALICSALAGSATAHLVPDNASEDISATVRVMDAIAHANPLAQCVCDCGESGTTLRLTLPIAAALGLRATFTGSGRLPKRPMKPYFYAFADSGASLEKVGGDGEWLPLRVSGKLTAGVYRLPGDVSSQFVSGLLLALPLLHGNSRILIDGELQSRPYVEMTIAAMAGFGVRVEDCGSDGWSICGGQRYCANALDAVEPDASQEAFWHLARFLGSRNLSLSPSCPQGSLQGDSVFPRLLLRLEKANAGDRQVFDVSQIPDLVPALAVAGAFSRCGLQIVRGERLRLKESDRLATTCAMLRAFGSSARETADGLIVPPADFRPTFSQKLPLIDGAGDHRIVMAAAIAATRVSCIVRGAGAVRKSYPLFFDEYRRLGGNVAPQL